MTGYITGEKFGTAFAHDYGANRPRQQDLASAVGIHELAKQNPDAVLAMREPGRPEGRIYRGEAAVTRARQHLEQVIQHIRERAPGASTRP